MSRVVQKKNHWSSKLTESSLYRDAREGLHVELRGGAENGEFSYVGDINEDLVTYQYGGLTEGELILEVEGLSVSGLPLYDVLEVVKNCKGPVRFRTVRQGKWCELWAIPVHLLFCHTLSPKVGFSVHLGNVFIGSDETTNLTIIVTSAPPSSWQMFLYGWWLSAKSTCAVRKRVVYF